MHYFLRRNRRGLTHPVQHISPTFQGDALEYGQHCIAKVVETGDAPLWTLKKIKGWGKQKNDVAAEKIIHFKNIHFYLLNKIEIAYRNEKQRNLWRGYKYLIKNKQTWQVNVIDIVGIYSFPILTPISFF